MSGSSCSTLRNGAGSTMLGVVAVGFIAILAFGFLGLAASADFQLAVRAACFLAGAGLAFMTWKVSRRVFPDEGRLELEVCDDTITLNRPGSRSEAFRRSDLESVELNEGGFNGVGSFSLYGPGQTLLGVWETNWVIKPPQLVMRALKRHGYPYALSSALHGNRRFYQRPGKPGHVERAVRRAGPVSNVAVPGGGGRMSAVDPWDVGISTPPQWFTLSLDAEHGEADIDMQLSARVESQPELVRARPILKDMLLSFAGEGRKLGAIFGAMRWEDHPREGVISATLLGYRLERDRFMGVAANLDSLTDLLARRTPSDQFDPVLSRVDLAWGRAVRMQAVRAADPGGKPTPSQLPLLLSVQYWVPIEATADLVELSFTTSNLAWADEACEEFALIAESLEIVY